MVCRARDWLATALSEGMGEVEVSWLSRRESGGYSTFISVVRRKGTVG